MPRQNGGHKGHDYPIYHLDPMNNGVHPAVTRRASLGGSIPSGSTKVKFVNNSTPFSELHMKQDIRRLQELSGILLEFAPEDVAKNEQPDTLIWATVDFGSQAKFAFGSMTDKTAIRNALLNIEENSHITRELKGDLDTFEFEAMNCIDEMRYGGEESINHEHAVLKHGMQLLRALREKANGAEIIKEVILADPGASGVDRNTELEYIVLLYDPKKVVPAVETRSLHWSGDQDYHLHPKK